MKRWFVAKTLARQETKTAIHLAKVAGVSVFLPMNVELVRDGRWMKPVTQGILFPRYVFFIVDSKRAPWGIIRNVRGIDHVMCDRDGKPIAVPYGQMRSLRNRGKKIDRRRLVSSFKRGQKVKITAGAFDGWHGEFEMAAKDRVKVLLDILGRCTTVDLDETQVKAA